MKHYGKIIGAIIGVIFAGPIGLVFGFILGHLYDLNYFHHFKQAIHGATHTHVQRLFFENTFKIMGYVAKSDGHVSEREIQAARAVMAQMNLDATMREEAIRLFNLGKRPDFDLKKSLFELRQACHMQPTLLQIFLEIQLQMASADGHLSPNKKATLQNICEHLGVPGFQFNQYEQQYQHAHQRGSYEPKTNQYKIDNPYEILDVSRSATPDEIKKAYRRLMSRNHPDKLIAKGLPPEMIKVATQKTQRIKQAYEQIKKEKGN